MADTRLVCTFDRQEDLIGAVSASRERGLTIVDAYAPYPVHGLSAAMGLQPSRLPWVCFVLGAIGGAAMLAFQQWASAVDWPINVGGRPWNSFPAYVPVAFEVIVLAAALGTVAAFFAAAGLRPGRKANVPNLRVSDDRFALVVVAGSVEQRKTVETVMARFRAAAIEDWGA